VYSCICALALEMAVFKKNNQFFHRAAYIAKVGTLPANSGLLRNLAAKPAGTHSRTFP
jgi:hypothetical protein